MSDKEHVYRLVKYNGNGPIIHTSIHPFTGKETKKLIECWYVVDRTKGVKRNQQQFFWVEKEID